MEQESLNKNDIFLTVKQAGAFLNLSIPTIKNYIYSGKLKSIKTPGGHHRIRMSDLSASMGLRQQELVVNEPLLELISKLISILEKREIFNQGHAESTARLSRKIAAQLELSDSRKNDLHLAALLHDIGKVDIKEKILNKTTKLTKDEFSAIKEHPSLGEKIVQSFPSCKRFSSIIRQHHERFDGQGYPDGLSGENIQIEARIITVSEAYDFMTRKTPFREAISPESALTELKKGTKTQFDPEIVKIFIKLQKKK